MDSEGSLGDRILNAIGDYNPNAIAIGHNPHAHKSALVGISSRCGQPSVLIYDYDLLVESFRKQFALEYSEEEAWDLATEHVSVNVEGVWRGENTPIVLYRPQF